MSGPPGGGPPAESQPIACAALDSEPAASILGNPTPPASSVAAHPVLVRAESELPNLPVFPRAAFKSARSKSTDIGTSESRRSSLPVSVIASSNESVEALAPHPKVKQSTWPGPDYPSLNSARVMPGGRVLSPEYESHESSQDALFGDGAAIHDSLHMSSASIAWPEAGPPSGNTVIPPPPSMSPPPSENATAPAAVVSATGEDAQEQQEAVVVQAAIPRAVSLPPRSSHKEKVEAPRRLSQRASYLPEVAVDQKSVIWSGTPEVVVAQEPAVSVDVSAEDTSSERGPDGFVAGVYTVLFANKLKRRVKAKRQAAREANLLKESTKTGPQAALRAHKVLRAALMASIAQSGEELLHIEECAEGEPDTRPRARSILDFTRRNRSTSKENARLVEDNKKVQKDKENKEKEKEKDVRGKPPGERIHEDDEINAVAMDALSRMEEFSEAPSRAPRSPRGLFRRSWAKDKKETKEPKTPDKAETLLTTDYNGVERLHCKECGDEECRQYWRRGVVNDCDICGCKPVKHARPQS